MNHNELKKLFDVIIVGAGPSGTTLGYILSEKGFKVLIIEKEKFPRPKLCGGLITWKSVNLLEKIFKVKFEEHFQLETKSKDFYAYEKYKKKVFTDSPAPFYFVDRKIYDMQLVNLARGKNCNFLFGEQVVDFDETSSTVITDLNNSFVAKIIVGADGVNSIIRRKILPNENFKHNIAVGYQVEVPIEKLKAKYQKRSPQLFFGTIKSGYSWVFPNRNCFLVGMGSLIRKNRDSRSRFIAFLKNITTDFIENHNVYKGHLVPFGNFVKIPGKDNVLLIGDSAGLVDPFIGEGIYYSHKSAECASNSIYRFFNSDEKHNLLESYINNLESIYKELKLAKRFRDIAYLKSFRLIAYTLARDMKYYYKFAKIIHGIKSYSRIPLLAKRL